MKIRILSNSGYTMMYVNGKIYDYGQFVKAPWLLDRLDDWGLLKDKRIFIEYYFDSYHAPYADEIDYLKPEHFTQEVDIKSFIFTDDDYKFTPFSFLKHLDPNIRKDFSEVVDYLLNHYKYREEEKENILNYIS